MFSPFLLPPAPPLGIDAQDGPCQDVHRALLLEGLEAVLVCALRDERPSELREARSFVAKATRYASGDISQSTASIPYNELAVVVAAVRTHELLEASMHSMDHGQLRPGRFRGEILQGATREKQEALVATVDKGEDGESVRQQERFGDPRPGINSVGAKVAKETKAHLPDGLIRVGEELGNERNGANAAQVRAQAHAILAKGVVDNLIQGCEGLLALFVGVGLEAQGEAPEGDGGMEVEVAGLQATRLQAWQRPYLAQVDGKVIALSR